MGKQENAQYGSGAGMAAGAGIGFALGGPGGAALGASLGSAGGGLLGGLFGSSNKGPDINIEAIMAQINAKIAAAGEVAKQRVRQQAGQQRGQATSNLASRGILRSGVSENVFGQIRDQSAQNQAGIDEQVLKQQAGSMSSLFFKGKQLESAQFQRQQQAKAARMGQIGAFAGSLMQAGLAARAGSTTQKLNTVPTTGSSAKSFFDQGGGGNSRFFSKLNLDGFGGDFGSNP